MRTWRAARHLSLATPADQAFDVVARFGELRFDDGAVFERGFADPTRAARRAYAAGAGLDWFPNKSLRFVLDFEATWFRFGARPEAGSTELAADRATERTLLARVQTAF